MRKRGDTTLIDLLNKIRTEYIDVSVESVSEEKFIHQNDPNYLDGVLHLFSEDVLVRNHSDTIYIK